MSSVNEEKSVMAFEKIEQARSAKPSKGWKEHFLRSGVPLEYEVARVLATEHMMVDADFCFLRRDVVGIKEWSVDLAATWYGPEANSINYELHLLLECKYRSPEKHMLFLEDPNIVVPLATLGGTVCTFDLLVPYTLSLDTFVPLESSLDFVYKGLELYDRGAFEEDLRHGIQQLRYATPDLLRRTFDFAMHSDPSEARAIFFTKILVTNAPIRILNRDADIQMIKAANAIADISRETNTVILYSDYGPDYEDHFRSVFKNGQDDRLYLARVIRKHLRESGKEITRLSDPTMFLKKFGQANRFECHSVGTQFFITTFEGLPSLLKEIKEGCRKSFNARIVPQA